MEIISRVIFKSNDPEFTPKRCSLCKIVKPSNCFYKHKGEKDGLHSQCKNCKNLRKAHDMAVSIVKKQKKKLSDWLIKDEEKVYSKKLNETYMSLGYSIYRINEDLYEVRSIHPKGHEQRQRKNYKQIIQFCKTAHIRFNPIDI